jgi:hypothetical protein
MVVKDMIFSQQSKFDVAKDKESASYDSFILKTNINEQD